MIQQPREAMSEATPLGGRQGAVAVIVRDGRLLVIRRSQQVVAPGKFCFPGGGMEAGETEEMTLVREIREELGVPIRPVRCLWRSVTPWHVTLSWWLCNMDAAAVPQPNPLEVESVQWFTPGEMAQLADLLESNAQFLKALASGPTAGPPRPGSEVRRSFLRRSVKSNT
jgi:8-oxo-dGTP diphosphatase